MFDIPPLVEIRVAIAILAATIPLVGTATTVSGSAAGVS